MQTLTAQASQELWGTSEAHTQTHTHTPTPQPGVAGRSWNPSPSAHTHTAHVNQEWRGTDRSRKQTHTNPNTLARRGGGQPQPEHKRTRQTQARNGGAKQNAYPSTRTQDPSQDWRGYRKTQTQKQPQHNSRKPSVHSPGTEAAPAMQVTRPNEIRRPGVRLHPKACAALGLEAERATPKHLGTPVPRTCMHALGTGYARKSGEPLGFCSKEGTCARTGAHPPGETRTSRWRRSALPVLPAAALLGATSQV